MNPEDVTFLIFAVWAGVILLAMAICVSRRRSAVIGFLLALCLGPLGMLACFFLPSGRRRYRRRR